MIPKKIHLCWLSGEAYPKQVRECLASWKKNLPDYEIIVWSRESIDFTRCRWAAQAVESKAYAFAADYVRFFALYHEGGIYLDSDVEVLKSFDRFLNQQYFFGFEYMGTPEAAVLGAKKGQRWIKRCLRWYETHDFVNADGTQNRIIAPLVLQDGFEREYKKRLTDKGQIIKTGGGTVYPYDWFSPKNVYSGKTAETENTYCVHHFNSSWLQKNAWVQITRFVHLCMIAVLGRKNHNCLMYYLRYLKPKEHSV